MNESSARSHHPTGRVLLCNIGRVGDTILRNSILDSVFRTYAAVDYLCGPGNFDVVRSDPRMDRVILLRNQPGHFLSLFKQALRQRYEGYIDLKDHDSSTSLLIARLFRCGNKTGVNRPRNRPFHHDTRGVWVPGLHKVEVMKLIAGKAGLIPGEFRPALVCPPEAAAWFRAHHPQAGPFILLNISATHPNRTWQAEKWIQFLREVALPAWPIVVNAVPADRPWISLLWRILKPFEIQPPTCPRDRVKSHISTVEAERPVFAPRISAVAGVSR